MNLVLGTGAIAAGVAAAVLGFVTMAVSLVRGLPRLARTARIYAWTVVAMSVVAFAVMERAMIQRDYTVAYVRFVNAISNAAPMTLYAKHTTTLTETAVGGAVTYKSAGAFTARGSPSRDRGSWRRTSRRA